MDRQPLIDKLNEGLRHEWTGVAQYSQAGFVVAGLWREVYSKLFFDNAKESFGHAKLVGEKIVAMGGIPTIERKPVKQTDDLMEMLQNARAFEAEAVGIYQAALDMAEQANDRPLVIFLENILLEEQEGVEEFEKILRQQKGAAEMSGSASKAS